MSRNALEDLVRLTAAVRQAEEARMQRLAEEETALRAELATLDAARRDAHALSAPELAGPRSVGADILWQGWVSRNRRTLQLRLARVLARKGDALRDLRRAHGRSEAAEALSISARRERHNDWLKAQITEEQRLILLKSGDRDVS